MSICQLIMRRAMRRAYAQGYAWRGDKEHSEEYGRI